MSTTERITINPDVCGGRPTIRGTIRLTFSLLTASRRFAHGKPSVRENALSERSESKGPHRLGLSP